MCGDATSREDVETLLDGLTADLTLTDPPYGIDLAKRSKQRRIGNHIVKTSARDTIIGDESTNAALVNYEIAASLSLDQIIFGGN